MAIELVRKVANATHGGEFDLLSTQTLGTKRFGAIGIGVDPTAPLHIRGATGTMRALIEKTGDGTAGLIMGNNVGAGTDKHWLIGVVASAQTQLHFRTVTDDAGSSPTTVFSILRTGNAFFNSGANTQLVTVDSANAGAAASVLAIRNSSLSAFNDGVKFVMGGGEFKFRDLADTTIGSINLTGGGSWAFGNSASGIGHTFYAANAAGGYLDATATAILNNGTEVGFRAAVTGVGQIAMFGASRNTGIDADHFGLIAMNQNDNANNYLWFNSGVLYTSQNAALRGGNGGTVVGTQTSDLRLKTDIEPYTKGLMAVMALKPITYKMISKKGNEREQVGFGAQDTLDIVPHAVYSAGEHYAMDYVRIIPALVNSIKELKLELDAYKSAHP